MLIGGYLTEFSFKFMGQYSPASFGFIKNLRLHLDKYCNLLQDIPEFWAKNSILFVEGESEEAFLNKLKATHFYELLKLNVISYNGRGNRKIKRIDMLLRDYKKRGYEIYIQGDADGANQDIFKELEKRRLISDTNKFVFKYDFESSIPACLLYANLQKLKLHEGINRDSFIEERKKHDGPVIPFLLEKYGVSIEPLKYEFAENVAEIIVKSHFSWQDEDFQATELGEFILFVRKMYLPYTQLSS